jgi:predicted Zn-dependent protease
MAWYGLAQTCLVRGDLKGAVPALDRAIAANPDHTAARSDRGCARLEAGDHAGAIEDFDEVIRREPHRALAWANRATAKLRAGRPAAEVVADLDRAIEEDPTNALAFFNRAVARVLTDPEQAEADLTRVLELEPQKAAAWEMRASLRASRNDFAGAVADAEKGASYDPRSGLCWGILAEGAMRRRDPRLAAELATRSLASPGAPVRVRYVRAWARDLAGDVAGAIEDLERYIASSPPPADAPQARAILEKLRAKR